MKTYKNLSSVIRQVVTEAHTKDTKDHDSGWIKKAPQGNVKDKMSQASELARKAMRRMQKKMKESFDLDITEEEADDLLNSIQEESEEMAEYGYTAEQHKKRAAEHKENADAARKSGNEMDYHFHMTKHHFSMMKAAQKAQKPSRGTFKSNEFPD